MEQFSKDKQTAEESSAAARPASPALPRAPLTLPSISPRDFPEADSINQDFEPAFKYNTKFEQSSQHKLIMRFLPASSAEAELSNKSLSNGFDPRSRWLGPAERYSIRALQTLEQLDQRFVKLLTDKNTKIVFQNSWQDICETHKLDKNTHRFVADYGFSPVDSKVKTGERQIFLSSNILELEVHGAKTQAAFARAFIYHSLVQELETSLLESGDESAIELNPIKNEELKLSLKHCLSECVKLYEARANEFQSERNKNRRLANWAERLKAEFQKQVAELE